MSKVISTLQKLGYLPDYYHLTGATDTAGEVKDAMRRYRKMVNAPSTLTDKEVLGIKRCGYADFTGNVYSDENGVITDTGSGSWPPNCHPEYPAIHSFAVFFDMRGMPSFWQKAFEAAWDLVCRAYANIGIQFFRTMNRAKANTIVTWQRGAGWIGLAIVPRGPKCGQQIWAKYDINYGSTFGIAKLINQLARLMGHEFGHNMGLGHMARGVMAPTLTNEEFSDTVWLSDLAFPTLKRWFGGVSVAPKIPIWTIPQPEIS